MGFDEKLFQVSVRAEDWIDFGEVSDVIAEVDLWREQDWTQPSSRRSNVLQVRKLLNDSSDIADSIVVRVFERPRIDLVELRIIRKLINSLAKLFNQHAHNGVLPPVGTCQSYENKDQPD
jgi:hypothetical protein